jgi:hypothetical protein
MVEVLMIMPQLGTLAFAWLIPKGDECVPPWVDESGTEIATLL